MSDGVRFGWNEEQGWQAEYAFAEATDEALAKVGAGKVASLACDALGDDPPVAWLCKVAVKAFVSAWIVSEFAGDSHGHWVAYFPHAQPHHRLQHGKW